MVKKLTSEQKNKIRKEVQSGKTLELLKQLLTQGYVDSARNCSQNLHTLRKHFPVIQRAQVDNKSFYFLDDKNKIALKAMLDMRKSKVISYHDLA